MFGSIIRDMVIDMNDARLNTVDQLVAFLEGTPEVDFRPQGNDAERYGFIGSVVARFAYRRLRRGDKGVVMRYLGRTTGYSRQQLTRLIPEFSQPWRRGLLDAQLQPNPGEADAS